jgi:hypothetical protein
MALQASLGGTSLPVQLSYEPYVPAKRNTVTSTANCVVIQAPRTSQIVHGEGGVSWTIQAATGDEFKTLFDLYNTDALTPYLFIGYYGDEYTVLFTQFDQPTVKSRLFELSGFFQVVCEVQSYQSTGNSGYNVSCTGGVTP